MLYWRSPIHFATGYGGCAIEMLKALEAAGIDWRAAVCGFFDSRFVPAHWVRSGKLWLRGDPPWDLRPGDCVFTYAQPSHLLAAPRAIGVAQVAYTMFETTKIPDGWAGDLNLLADLTLVPCSQNLQSFRACGAERVGLLPHGVDVKQWYPNGGRTSPFFVFGMAGTLSSRKGADVAIGAFCEAFSEEERRDFVRLVVKSRGGSVPHFGKVGPPLGVLVIDADWDQSRMRHFYQSLDVYVSPTRGEGFGLTPVQAMLCGVPCIATRWGGTADTVTEGVGYPLRSRLTVANGYEPCYGDVGLWAEPDVFHLSALMRRCYEHRLEVRSKGHAASREARSLWSMDRFVERLRASLEPLGVML